MEATMLSSAGHALLIILDPLRMLYLFGGVCMGLALGILPGIGGVAGLALLLPFTFNMDAPAAFALLLGLGATTTTADPISAILFGVPGHAASAATTLDGYPLTRRGQAGRALGASYMSALMGGLFGAALMGISLPILRPLMLCIGSFMGAIPGIAVSIIDWISYGHALRTEKGAPQTFGKGDIRGVIAAESATNAREGGALVPMVAFGVPTSAGMAVLLGAFLIHG